MSKIPDARRWTPDETLATAFAGTAFTEAVAALHAAIAARGDALVHGSLPRWRAALAALPQGDRPWLCGDSAVVRAGTSDACDAGNDPAIRAALMQLRPWRKGPFRLHGVDIDTEWRSDLKWDRLSAHIAPLAGRHVLDVGSGSGYHLWRMRAAGAAAVLGIEPMLLYQCQFDALGRCAPDEPVRQLPLRLQDLPHRLRADSVFSMGVLYHAHDPAEHLAQLYAALRPGGQCVLETLVLERDDDSGLAIAERYAGMRNVHALPSLGRLQRWLASAGFTDVRCVSMNRTTSAEQRRTAWSEGHSLADALDPACPSRTVEGHPAPCRAVLLAETRITA